MIPLPSGSVVAFEDWLSVRWSVASWFVRRGSLLCSFGLLGLRWSEVEIIQPGDVDVEAGGLYVRTRKRGMPRRIQAPDRLLAAAVKLRGEVAGGADRLFVRRTGLALMYGDQRRFTFTATKRVFGRAFSFHCFRHTAAVRVYERTRDVLAVQRYLGHRSLMWTEVYLRSLMVIDVGGPVAFCGGGPAGGVRLFDPDEKLSRVATVRAVASRGKARAASDEVALDGDRQGEAKPAVCSVGCCVLESLIPARSMVLGEFRGTCRKCGSLWQWTRESKGMVLVKRGEWVAASTPVTSPDPPAVSCATVHANQEVRRSDGGAEIWCADCGRYLGLQTPGNRPRRGSPVDQRWLW
jgi:hypothetical protein